MKKRILATALAMLAAAAAHAGPPAPKTQGIESKDYKWNAQEGEKIEALKLKGDRKRGEEAYEVCGACHLPSGAGRPDAMAKLAAMMSAAGMPTVARGGVTP